MTSPESKRRFINYPEPLKGPDVPYKNERKSNPALRGVVVAVCAVLIEWLRPLRQSVWRNAGFGSLRSIREHLEDYEPFFEPTIIPCPDDDAPEKSLSAAQDAWKQLGPSPGSQWPASKYYSVEDYHELFVSGELTPTEVARALLPLIQKDAVPKQQYSDAWFYTKADMVMKAAEASTRRYKEKCPLGILDGIPVPVKDEYEVDGYTTCLGSRNDYTAPVVEGQSSASWCVRQLEAAGCVILGKLHMVEFGLDTPGNNPILGTPRNPYNYKYYTGGSSSGAGYAVAAGLVPIALGSDGGGSIRIPASFCSVFGLKPTHGRLSFRPGPNHCITCACLGPMAADIRSLAAVYQAIGTPPSASPFPHIPPAPTLLTPSSPARPKLLGIPEAWFSTAAPGVQRQCRSLIASLVATHGYTAVPVTIPFLPEGQVAHAMTVLNDAATLLPETRNLTPTTRILLAIGRATPATDYTLAQKLRRLLAQHLAHLWRAHPGLVLVTPTTACAGWRIEGKAELAWGLSDGDRTLQSMAFVWLANFAGLPSLTVPAGYVVPEGAAVGGWEAVEVGREVAGMVPVGLMATGEWASEAELLQFGLDAEAAGAERRARPPIWVDVVERAKEARE